MCFSRKEELGEAQSPPCINARRGGRPKGERDSASLHRRPGWFSESTATSKENHPICAAKVASHLQFAGANFPSLRNARRGFASAKLHLYPPTFLKSLTAPLFPALRAC